jgi:hypothetical protein
MSADGEIPRSKTKSAKSGGSKKNNFRSVYPVNPAELKMMLSRYKCQELLPDSAVTTAIPTLPQDQSGDMEQQSWDAISSRAWALKERNDGKKLHVQVRYMTVMVMQRSFVNQLMQSENSNPPIERCKLSLPISSTATSDGQDALIYKEMLKLGCPKDKCILGGASGKEKREMAPVKVRSSVHKMVCWEVTQIKAEVEISSSMSFEKEGDLTDTLRHFGLKPAMNWNDGLVKQLFKEVSDGTTVLHSPPNLPGAMFRAVCSLGIKMARDHKVLIETHCKSEAKDGDHKLREVYRPLEAVMLATDSWAHSTERAATHFLQLQGGQPAEVSAAEVPALNKYIGLYLY